MQPWERPTLRWLCAHMPAFVTPDMLTTVGFFGAILTGVGYWLASYEPLMLLVACLGLIVNWFGDSLDGNLARFRGIERPTYGFFVDHTTDVFEQVIIAAGMAASGFYRFELVVIGLIVYLLLSILTFVRAHFLKILQIAYSGFGPTEIRTSFILGNLLILMFPPQPLSVLGISTTYPNCFAATWIIAGGSVLIGLVVQTMGQLRSVRWNVAEDQQETSQT